MVELTNADVLIFTRNRRGDLVRHEEVSLEDFDGVVPSVGDRIATMLMDEDDGIAAYLVTQRYRMRGAGAGEHDRWSPWVLVVEQVNGDDDLEIDELVRVVRHEELVCRKFAVAFAEVKRKRSTVDDLDRDNRDPVLLDTRAQRAPSAGACRTNEALEVAVTSENTPPFKALDNLPIFASDKEIAVAIVGRANAAKWIREALPILERRGFPIPNALHGGRAVPLVRKFYEGYFGITAGFAMAKPDGEERLGQWSKRKKA